MPDSHLAYKRDREQNAAKLLERASYAGHYVEWAAGDVLAKSRFPQQVYGTCNAILSLGRTYSNARLDNACRLLTEKSVSVTYRILSEMLKNNRDLALHRMTSNRHRRVLM